MDGNNEVMYAMASKITFICQMDFNAFPVDIQVWEHSEETNWRTCLYHISADECLPFAQPPTEPYKAPLHYVKLNKGKVRATFGFF